MLKIKSLNTSLLQSVRLAAPVFLLLGLAPGNALADRPAMEEAQHTMHAESSDEQRAMNPDTAGEGENRPAMPSSVEIIMQQQPEASVQQHSGDVLQLQPVEIQPGQSIPVQVLDTPRRGASMDKVQRELGQPISISDSVGQPPITRWTYPDRVVYFEYSNVIHVVKRQQ
ncbi:MAG TPA: hypothetical protein ENJ11_05785 [Gammaproteobacteria bacterium]|nr:hypothetical protein [Gammaproteobacteria bacterium]